MVITVAKILETEPSQLDIQPGILGNPFRNWKKIKSNGTNFQNVVESQQEMATNTSDKLFQSEKLARSFYAMDLSGTSVDNINSSMGAFQPRNFLHFAVISPLSFFAFLGICAFLMLIFKRRMSNSQGNGRNCKLELEAGSSKCEIDKETNCEPIATIAISGENSVDFSNAWQTASEQNKFTMTDKFYAVLKKLLGYLFHNESGHSSPLQHDSHTNGHIFHTEDVDIRQTLQMEPLQRLPRNDYGFVENSEVIRKMEDARKGNCFHCHRQALWPEEKHNQYQNYACVY